MTLETKIKKENQLHVSKFVVKLLRHKFCQKVAQNFKVFEKEIRIVARGRETLQNRSARLTTLPGTLMGCKHFWIGDFLTSESPKT